MNYCFPPAHTWAAMQKGQNSERIRISVFTAAISVLAVMVVSAGILPAQERTNDTHVPPQFDMEAQTTCETEMLREMGAREIFSAEAYDVLTEVSRAYDRAIPHIYIVPATFNMVYIAGSTAVDGRGKIVVGEQAIDLFDAFSLKGFLGHEMAHLVSDTGAQGCNDYMLRDPQIEADADALAMQRLGAAPVEAFLERLLALTQPQNSEAKQRLEQLHSFQATKEQWHTMPLAPVGGQPSEKTGTTISSVVESRGQLLQKNHVYAALQP